MANISSINGNPIVVGTSGIEDGAVTAAKLEDGSVGGVIDSVNRLNDLSYAIENNSMPVNWFERGSLTNGVPDGYRTGSRAHTVDILKFDTAATLTVKSGQYGVHYFNASNQFTNWSGWKTSSDTVFIPANQKFKILITTSNTAPESQIDALADIVGIGVLKVDGAQKRTIERYGMKFEHGGITNGADDTYGQQARVRSIGITQLPHSINVSMSSGSYIVHIFDQNDVFVSNTTWRTTDKFFIPARQKFRLILTPDPTDPATADLQTLVNALKIEESGCFNSISAVPNVILACRNVDSEHIPPESKWYVQAAAMNQYDRVRFTVRKTTDGHYFNCHDDFINNVARNMDGSVIGTTVYANNQTLETLNQYDWGIKYGAQYAGATAPLLEDTLKWAALYNMGVTWHSASGQVETDETIAEQIEMLDKYGLTDNLLCITASGNNLTTLSKFVAHNPRVSCFVGATSDWWTDENIAAVKALQTGFNKMYVQLYPWGTVPTDAFLAMAKSNNFLLYNSYVMSASDLLKVDTFSHGYSYIEAQNIYAIKDTLRNWVNSLIDA